jgi:mycofactocin precursor
MDGRGHDALSNGSGGQADEPVILEEIEVEDLAVDGICGVY